MGLCAGDDFSKPSLSLVSGAQELALISLNRTAVRLTGRDDYCRTVTDNYSLNSSNGYL